MIKSKVLSAYILVLLIVSTYVSLINTNVFSLFSTWSLYINTLVILIVYLLNKKKEKSFILFLCFLVIYLFCSLLLNLGGIGSVITFIGSILLLSCFEESSFDNIIEKILKYASIIVLVFLFIDSFNCAADYYWYRYNAINPNTMGMFMMFAFMMYFSFTDLKKRLSKINFLVILILTFLGMYNYESRGTTAVLVCFVLLNCIPSKLLTARNFIFITLGVIVIGILFPFIYLHLYSARIDLTIFGKTLYTGREAIWFNMFTVLQDNSKGWLFGLGSKVELWNNHSLNVHNNFFAVIVNFGVVGFGLFYGYVTYKIRKTVAYIENVTIRRLLIMFLCSVLILGISETTTLWPTIFPFSSFGLGVACSKTKEINEKMRKK